jgi:broad specificity phosphatase PhoE
VDVALRLRSLRDSLGREHLDDRVLLVCHEVVVVMWRYLVEDLDEQQALALSRDHPLANCALTTYVTDADDRLKLDRDGWTAEMEAEQVPVTEEHDVHVGPR